MEHDHRHLTIEQLADVLACHIEQEALVRHILSHLFSVCEPCRAQYEELLKLQKKVGHWDERVAVYESEQADVLHAALQGLPFEEQLRKVTEDEDFHSWALCKLLVEESQILVFDEPCQAVNTAELAVVISLQLSDAYDINWVADMRARVHAHLGNARRVLGEMRSAEAAFALADEFLAASMTGDELVRAEVLHLKSSLFCQQRRMEDALALAEESLAIYRAGKEPLGVATVLVKKAKIFEERGDLETAIQALREASEEIDIVQDIRLSVYARHNLVVCLAASGRHEEAQEFLLKIKPLFQTVARPLDLVRLRWAEARIDRGLGNEEIAEQAFRQVRTEFIQRKMAYDAALASLDLSLILLNQKRTEELKAIARELVAFFEAQDVRREVFASLSLFQRACQEERITAELIRQISQIIESELRCMPRR